MSQDAVESFLGRIITDSNFRQLACSSMECACLSAGIPVSAKEMSYLKTLDFSQFADMAERIDGAIRRS